MTIKQFQKHILSWYKTSRRSLPWRNTKDPYKILISEVMLQQTQVARVLPKYKEFLTVFPSLRILARARIKRLLKVWSGLGYWRRAKYLKETAQILMRAQAMNLQTSPRRPIAGREHRLANFAGNLNSRSFEIPLPSDLETLPGIGHYTARALACFAFGNTEAFLDTNIRRVYLHFFFPSTRSARSGHAPKKISDAEILPIAQRAIWKKNPKEWHYALFDYGAIVLKNKEINKQSAQYHKQSKFKGSFRFFRTKIMHFLLGQPKQTATKSRIKRFLKEAQSPYLPRENPHCP